MVPHSAKIGHLAYFWREFFEKNGRFVHPASLAMDSMEKKPEKLAPKIGLFLKIFTNFTKFCHFLAPISNIPFWMKKMENLAPKWTFFSMSKVLCNLQPLSIFEPFFEILAYFWIPSDRIGREWGKWPLFLDKFGTKSPNLANLGSTLDFRFQTKNRIFGSKFYIHSILNHWPIIGPTFGAENRHFSPKKAQNSEKPIPMPGSPEPENSWHIHPSLGAKFWTTPAHGPAENRPKIWRRNFTFFSQKSPKIRKINKPKNTGKV